jgi:ubiquitin-like-conjugating enzyme ATG3
MSVFGQLRAAREYMYPTRKTSAFLDKGVLTPEEFVIAGDEIVFKCPTWAWESGDPLKRKSHLPDDKQYLVTRHVPCQNRVSAMENMVAMEGDDDDEGDWLVSHVIKHQTIEDEFDIIDDEGEVITKEKPKEDEEGDEYTDMADYEDDNIMEDEAAVAAAAPEDDDNLVKVRTYDLSITYDKYYQTPRVWMMGYTSSKQPLSGKEMMEDVITDYANRTVTIENHPHVSGPHASIHPCQHGKVMKTIVRNLIKATGDGEEGPAVNVYLFIFLKFVSSIIPTINYDFTMQVSANTSK